MDLLSKLHAWKVNNIFQTVPQLDTTMSTVFMDGHKQNLP